MSLNELMRFDDCRPFLPFYFACALRAATMLTLLASFSPTRSCLGKNDDISLIRQKRDIEQKRISFPFTPHHFAWPRKIFHATSPKLTLTPTPSSVPTTNGRRRHGHLLAHYLFYHLHVAIFYIFYLLPFR